MKTKSEVIQCSNSSAMIEKADIIHDGKTFEGMGSFLQENPKTKRFEGLLYRLGELTEGRGTRRINTSKNWSKWQKGFVGSWDGSLKIPAYYLNEWMSNFGDMRQAVYFILNGKPFYGIYYKTNSDIIRVKEMKDKPHWLLEDGE